MIVIILIVVLVVLLVVHSQHNVDNQNHHQFQVHYHHEQHQHQHQQHHQQQQQQHHHHHHHHHNNRKLTHLDTYPWGGNFDDRQDQILEELQDNPTILMNNNMIPQIYTSSSTNNNKMYIRNVEGLRFSISKHNNQKQKQVEKRITKVSTIKSYFKNICAVLPAQYWNYEWCFRSEIKQFHLEPPLEDDQQVRRSPEWSLGVYSYSNIIVLTIV